MNNYWAQWSREEIDSMKGLEQYYREIEEVDANLDQYEVDVSLDQDQGEQLSLETLGMSWRDFM